jgi:ASC-1-like (ASCH) protein
MSSTNYLVVTEFMFNELGNVGEGVIATINKGPFNTFSLGDNILIKYNPDSSYSLNATITQIKKYNSISNMLERESIEDCLHSNTSIDRVVKNYYRKKWNESLEDKFGVLSIRVEVNYR